MSQPLYKSWQGNNLFILGGRFMLGSSYRHLCITGASEAHTWHSHLRGSMPACPSPLSVSLQLTPTHANSRHLTTTPGESPTCPLTLTSSLVLSPPSLPWRLQWSSPQPRSWSSSPRRLSPSSPSSSPSSYTPRPSPSSLSPPWWSRGSSRGTPRTRTWSRRGTRRRTRR